MHYIVAQMPRDLQARIGITTRIPDLHEGHEAQKKARDLIRLAVELGAMGFFLEEAP